MTVLPIPAEALEDCGAILGRRGSGKSNTMQVLFERELDAEHRSVMIDPKGDRWGIRLNPDGSPSRFQIPIFGGEHGDYSLSEDDGERLGSLIATSNLSCVIDLSHPDLSLGAKHRFMLDFAPELLRRNRHPLTLFVEEVDQFANQDPRYQPPKLVHHMMNLVMLGRQKGIVMWMASQRAAKVNKNLLTQVDTLVAMKVTSPNDRAVYKDWFGGHSAEAGKRVSDEASSLKPGEGFAWIAGHDSFDRVRFPLASTFDSGATPKHGEVRPDVALERVGQADLDAMFGLREADAESQVIAAAVNGAIETGVLRGATDLASGLEPHVRIVELEAEVAMLRERDRRVAFWRRKAHDYHRICQSYRNIAIENRRFLDEIVDAGDFPSLPINDEPLGLRPGDTARLGVVAGTIRDVEPASAVAAAFEQMPEPKQYKVGDRVTVNGEEAVCVGGGSKGLSGPQERIIGAIAWCERFLGKSSAPKSLVAFLAGASPKSSSFANNLGALRTGGWIDYPGKGEVALVGRAREHMAAAVGKEKLTTAHLVAHIGEKISGPQRQILEMLVSLYPASAPREAIAKAIGASPTSSSFANNLGFLRSQLGVIDYPSGGMVRAADMLFPKGQK